MPQRASSRCSDLPAIPSRRAARRYTAVAGVDDGAHVRTLDGGQLRVDGIGEAQAQQRFGFVDGVQLAAGHVRAYAARRRHRYSRAQFTEVLG